MRIHPKLRIESQRDSSSIEFVPSVLAALEKIFKRFDVDADGVWSLPELRCFLKATSSDDSAEFSDDLLSETCRICGGGDGGMRPNELIELYRHSYADADSLEMGDKQLWKDLKSLGAASGVKADSATKLAGIFGGQPRSSKRQQPTKTVTRLKKPKTSSGDAAAPAPVPAATAAAAFANIFAKKKPAASSSTPATAKKTATIKKLQPKKGSTSFFENVKRDSLKAKKLKAQREALKTKNWILSEFPSGGKLWKNVKGSDEPPATRVVRTSSFLPQSGPYEFKRSKEDSSSTTHSIAPFEAPRPPNADRLLDCVARGVRIFKENTLDLASALQPIKIEEFLGSKIVSKAFRDWLVEFETKVVSPEEEEDEDAFLESDREEYCQGFVLFGPTGVCAASLVAAVAADSGYEVRRFSKDVDRTTVEFKRTLSQIASNVSLGKRVVVMLDDVDDDDLVDGLGSTVSALLKSSKVPLVLTCESELPLYLSSDGYTLTRAGLFATMAYLPPVEFHSLVFYVRSLMSELKLPSSNDSTAAYVVETCGLDLRKIIKLLETWGEDYMLGLEHLLTERVPTRRVEHLAAIDRRTTGEPPSEDVFELFRAIPRRGDVSKSHKIEIKGGKFFPKNVCDYYAIDVATNRRFVCDVIDEFTLSLCISKGDAIDLKKNVHMTLLRNTMENADDAVRRAKARDTAASIKLSARVLTVVGVPAGTRCELTTNDFVTFEYVCSEEEVADDDDADDDRRALAPRWKKPESDNNTLMSLFDENKAACYLPNTAKRQLLDKRMFDLSDALREITTWENSRRNVLEYYECGVRLLAKLETPTVRRSRTFSRTFDSYGLDVDQLATL